MAGWRETNTSIFLGTKGALNFSDNKKKHLERNIHKAGKKRGTPLNSSRTILKFPEVLERQPAVFTYGWVGRGRHGRELK